MSSSPYFAKYDGLHDGVAIVSGIDGFEQFAYLQL